MKRLNFLALPFVICALLLVTSCAPNEEEVQTTIQLEISQLVEATIAAMPSLTLRPTLTAYPTERPANTYTPFPTLTHLYTPTVLPTYTPRSTFTPVPTDTPTSTPQPTSNQVSGTNSNDTQNFTTDPNLFLLANINRALLEVQAFRGLIPPFCIAFTYANGYRNCTGWKYDADCLRVVNAFDSIARLRDLNTSFEDPTLASAYITYQAGIDYFIGHEQEWVDECRQAITTGSIVEVDFGKSVNELFPPINEAINILHQARQSITQS